MNNGAFSESNVNAFSSHAAQYKYSMPAGKEDYVAMKMYGWTGHESSSGFSDIARPTLGRIYF
jgi:hypothetical protein